MLKLEETINIDGKEYSKTDSSITKDCFDDDVYIHVRNCNYYTYYIFKGLNNSRFTVEEGYSKRRPGYVVPVRIKTTLQAHLVIHFKSYEDVNKFADANNLMYNEDSEFYHFEHEYNLFNRVKPRNFDNTRKLVTPDILKYWIRIPDNHANTKEYKEICNFFKYKNSLHGMDSLTFLETEGIRHTFGVEIETISGSFKDSEVSHLNMKAVHDGSLRDADGSGPWGKEYVTGVLKGDAGFKHLQEITKTIASKCTVDQRASVHVHIGSLKWNSEEIVMAYLLGEILEEELFAMMPKSRGNNEYCKKLNSLSVRNKALLKIAKDKKSYKKAIDKLYAEVFKEVGRINKPNRNYNKKSVSPDGQHGGWDRQVCHRYKWLNFTNIIFNQRGSMDYKTIEFRNHSATMNYKKIRNWIKICMAFVEFVHNNKKSIILREHKGRPITIKSILEEVYPKTSDYLVKYVQSRKELFSKESNQTLDYSEKVDNHFNNHKELIRCV